MFCGSQMAANQKVATCWITCWLKNNHHISKASFAVFQPTISDCAKPLDYEDHFHCLAAIGCFVELQHILHLHLHGQVYLCNCIYISFRPNGPLLPGIVNRISLELLLQQFSKQFNFLSVCIIVSNNFKKYIHFTFLFIIILNLVLQKSIAQAHIIGSN